jgi:nicotinate-nucleotide pyrophosphorylase (carboxylating)
MKASVRRPFALCVRRATVSCTFNPEQCISTIVITDATDQLIRLALAEDVGTGDRTTLATIPAETRCSARVVAKEPLVLAGCIYAIRVFQHVDPTVQVTQLAQDGDVIAPGVDVLAIEGAARSVLTAERTALNILQRLTGVATLTRRFVEAIAGSDARITDTRKTTPGMRAMQKQAVLAGGGSNHRFGLDSGILIKDNHIAACGSVAAAVERARLGSPHSLRIEVEVTGLEELDMALAAGADIIMLDNMSTEAMAEAVTRSRRRAQPVLLEASGNLTLDRVAEVAATGVDLLSVGALTHSARSADLSLLFEGT